MSHYVEYVNGVNVISCYSTGVEDQIDDSPGLVMKQGTPVSNQRVLGLGSYQSADKV